jgi:hypothetical protein
LFEKNGWQSSSSFSSFNGYVRRREEEKGKNTKTKLRFIIQNPKGFIIAFGMSHFLRMPLV